jgi:2-polyprenyl-6-methoxyphenol hydroxylase-like FAD-dependent oxidoreductase
MTMPVPSHPAVAIVGGGLGGLVLARVLQVHGVPCTVYELDASAAARDQGGTLDMHEESGQRALREAGLFEEFRQLVRPGGEATRVLDRDGTVLVDKDGGEEDRPEVDRAALRDLLAGSLDKGRIAWGHKVSAVRSLDGRYELTFDDGRTTVADLLVGADGAWSKVRPLVSAAKPEYTRISFLELRLSEVDDRHPAAAALVGSGTMFALSGGRCLIGQRNGGGRIRVYAALEVPEGWLANRDVDWSDPTAARETLLAEFADWSSELTDLIRGCEDPVIPRPTYALPAGHAWPRVPGVTLLGDAAHVMSPFAGEGANLAMLDAAELALAIVEHPGDIETALTRYEESLFPRAKEAATESAEGLELCFRADAPRGLVEFFSSMQGQTA